MRLDNTQLNISKTVESAFNTPEASSGNYEWCPSTDPIFILPKLEKVNDAGRIGRNASSHQCNTYWSPAQISIKDDVETGVPARLLRRGLGGLSTPTLVATGVYDHDFAILPPQVGDVLPSFNIMSVLGAADYLLAGLMVNKFKWSQKSGDRVQHETDIVGSGKFATPSGKTLNPLGDLPCMDGHKTAISYKEPGGASGVNLSNLGLVAEWMVEHDNKIRTNRRRSGDPTQTVNGEEGAYVRKMPRGKYTTAGQIILEFVDLTYWLKSVKNEICEDFSILIPGPKIDATYRHEIELIFPRFSFDSPDTGADEDDAATPINLIFHEDPVTKGTMRVRVRNTNATLV